MIHNKPGEFHLFTGEVAVLAPITLNDSQGEELFGELADLLEMHMAVIEQTVKEKYGDRLLRFAFKY